jgi:hypothetical protein
VRGMRRHCQGEHCGAEADGRQSRKLSRTHWIVSRGWTLTPAFP